MGVSFLSLNISLSLSLKCGQSRMTIVSSAILMMVLELWVSTQPQGAPVLRVSQDDVLPVHTAWSLPVRKFKIQSHRAVLNPRSLSLMTSLEGTMVLNVIVNGAFSHECSSGSGGRGQCGGPWQWHSQLICLACMQSAVGPVSQGGRR